MYSKPPRKFIFLSSQKSCRETEGCEEEGEKRIRLALRNVSNFPDRSGNNICQTRVSMLIIRYLFPPISPAYSTFLLQEKKGKKGEEEGESVTAQKASCLEGGGMPIISFSSLSSLGMPMISLPLLSIQENFPPLSRFWTTEPSLSHKVRNKKWAWGTSLPRFKFPTSPAENMGKWNLSLFFRETKVSARVYKHHLTKPRPAPHTSKIFQTPKSLPAKKLDFQVFHFPAFRFCGKSGEKSRKEFFALSKN